MKRGRPKGTFNRNVNDLSGPEKELMRKLARALWTRKELAYFFRADLAAVDEVIKNTLKWKRKKEPKGLSDIKNRIVNCEGD
jgi:hypothetical protein